MLRYQEGKVRMNLEENNNDLQQPFKQRKEKLQQQHQFNIHTLLFSLGGNTFLSFYLILWVTAIIFFPLKEPG